MTIRDAIYAVFEGTGKSSDDFPVRKRFVYNELKVAYQELVKQELNKGRLWNGQSAKTLQCITLERADLASCFDGCESGISILRSREPLPKLIESEGGLAITGLYLMNGQMINPIPRSDWQNRKKKRYQKPNTFGFFPVNNVLYLVDYDDIDELLVDVAGFWNDPEEIEKRNRKADDNCETKCQPIDEFEFDCPGHISRRVIEIARQVVFRKLGIPEDKTNNAKSDLNVQGKAQPAGG